jgi:hypothetical protein
VCSCMWWLAAASSETLPGLTSEQTALKIMEHGSFHQAWAYQRDRAVFVAGGGVPTREEAATWARWQFAGVVEEGGPAAEAPEATGRLQRQFFPEEVEGGVERTEGFEAVDLYGVTEEEWGVPFAALAAGAEAVAETREAVDVEDEEVASPEADDVEDEEEDEGVGEEDEEELEFLVQIVRDTSRHFQSAECISCHGGALHTAVLHTVLLALQR